MQQILDLDNTASGNKARFYQQTVAAFPTIQESSFVTRRCQVTDSTTTNGWENEHKNEELELVGHR